MFKENGAPIGVETPEAPETIEEAFERMPSNKILTDIVAEMQRVRNIGEGLPLGKSAEEVYVDLNMHLQIMLLDPSLEKFESQVREVMNSLPAADVRRVIKNAKKALSEGGTGGADEACAKIDKAIKFWQDEYFVRFEPADLNFFNEAMTEIKA